MTEPYSPLEAGMRVVCIDAKPRNSFKPSLVEGEVYVVASVQISGDSLMAYIENPPDGPGVIPWGYYADRFRPVRDVDTTKEVEALKKIVDDVFKKEPVNV